MLTDKQVLEDAKALVRDLLLDLQVRELALQDEKLALHEAARVLATASQVLINLINQKSEPTMH